jgi:hypothetical protein
MTGIANMIRVALWALASVVLAMPATSFAEEGIYVCSGLNPDGSCAAFVAVLDGLASFEEIGITTEAIALCMGFGAGAVLLFFAIGLGVGAAHRVLNTIFGVTHYD